MSATLSRLFLIILSLLYPLSLLIWLVFLVALGGTASVTSGTPEQITALTGFRYLVWLYPATIALALGGGWWLQSQGRFLGASLVGAIPVFHLLIIVGILIALAPTPSN